LPPADEETNMAELVGKAAAALRAGLVRDPERVAPGPHEVEEFGSALRDALKAELVASETEGDVRLAHRAPIVDWNRPTAGVDLAVVDDSELALVAELEVRDIGHQLFDVAKVCCLLKAGARAGFLFCIAESPDAFDRMPGGELFRDRAGLEHQDVFPIIFQRHPAEARSHLRRSRPGPISLPRRFSTTAVCDPLDLDAHPGHQLRVVEVRIEDSTAMTIPPELIGDD
jgi:hypothetical protein